VKRKDLVQHEATSIHRLAVAKASDGDATAIVNGMVV